MSDNEMTIAELHRYQETGKLPKRFQKKTRLETITGVADKAPELLEQAVQPRRNKYGAIPTEIDGITFASKREAARYAELKARQANGEIRGLEYNHRYVFNHNGVRIGSYRPDFQYTDTATGEFIVEDVKSRPTETRDYRLRKKMMKAFYDIDVQEVY